MEKFLKIILIFALVFSLSGCGEKPQTNNAEANLGAIDNAGASNNSDLEQFKIPGSGGNRYFGDDITMVRANGFKYSYWHKTSGAKVREIDIKGVTAPSEPIVIAMVTDGHLKPEENILNAFRVSMSLAEKADQMVLCGDNVEGFSDAANAELFKENVLKKYPEIVCVVGNHDMYSENEVENNNYLKDIWPHDHNYFSKTIKDNVVIVAVDNSKSSFTAEQCDKLASDIAAARSSGKTVLFFHHIPFNTLDNSLGANKRMHELLTSNADVVKAAFSGHLHSDNVVEIDATANGKSVKLPIYTLEGSSLKYFKGNVLFITIE